MVQAETAQLQISLESRDEQHPQVILISGLVWPAKYFSQREAKTGEVPGEISHTFYTFYLSKTLIPIWCVCLCIIHDLDFDSCTPEPLGRKTSQGLSVLL